MPHRSLVPCHVYRTGAGPFRNHIVWVMSGNLEVAGNEIGNKDLFFPHGCHCTVATLHSLLAGSRTRTKCSSRGLEENVDLFGVCQCYLELFRGIWRHLKQFGAVWCHFFYKMVGPFRAIWSHLDPFGFIWSYFEPLTTFWSLLEAFQAIRSPLRPYGAI